MSALVSIGLVVWLAVIAWIVYEMLRAPTIDESHPESQLDIRDRFQDQHGPLAARLQPEPVLSVVVFDDTGVHHGTLNSDDSVTVRKPYDWGDAA